MRTASNLCVISAIFHTGKCDFPTLLRKKLCPCSVKKWQCFWHFFLAASSSRVNFLTLHCKTKKVQDKKRMSWVPVVAMSLDWAVFLSGTVIKGHMLAEVDCEMVEKVGEGLGWLGGGQSRWPGLSPKKYHPRRCPRVAVSRLCTDGSGTPRPQIGWCPHITQSARSLPLQAGPKLSWTSDRPSMLFDPM